MTTWRRSGRAPPLPPRAPGAEPIIGHARALRADPLELFRRAMEHCGDTAELRVGPRRLLLVTDPADIRVVLKERHEDFPRETRAHDKLRRVVGESLSTTEGPRWRHQRRLAQPVFRSESVLAFADVMERAAGRCTQRLGTHADDRSVVDVEAQMRRVALDVVGEALLGSAVAQRADDIAAALATLMWETFRRTLSVVDVPLVWPTPANLRFLHAQKTLDDIVERVVEQRRRVETCEHDLLGRLIRARDPETGASLTRKELHDALLTFLIGGHETTANALTWTWYLLSRSHAALTRLHDELDAVLGDREPRVADLPRLPWTRATLLEAMRLYPPGWAIVRTARRDDVLGGYRVPAGTMIFISPWATHRRPEDWPDPEVFDPGRFTAGKPPDAAGFTYLPFGAGPHICIGREFAFTEMQLVLAAAAQRYVVTPLAGRPVVPAPRVTLGIRDGLRSRVEHRARSGGLKTPA